MLYNFVDWLNHFFKFFYVTLEFLHLFLDQVRIICSSLCQIFIMNLIHRPNDSKNLSVDDIHFSFFFTPHHFIPHPILPKNTGLYISMGISAEQHKVRVGCFNNVGFCNDLKANSNIVLNNINAYKDNNQTDPDRPTQTNVFKLNPALSILGYVFILIIMAIFSMTIDLMKNSDHSCHFSVNLTMIDYVNSNATRFLINWATLTILFLIKIPTNHTCIFTLLISKKHKMGKSTCMNFLFMLFSRDKITIFYYIASVNLILIVIVTPSIVNPGPENAKLRPLTLFFNNVQGLLTINSLKSSSPRLDTTKLHELHGYIYRNRPDIIILNETWLTGSIKDAEILPEESYKIFRLDRSRKTHPFDPSNPKKFREGGGGILIAHRRDLDIKSEKVGVKLVQAEILTIKLKLPSGKVLSISTFYRVGTLGSDNYELVKDYLFTLATKKRLDKHILIGDLNFPEISWPDSNTTNELHGDFIKLLMGDLGHSQLIDKATRKSGNILDLLFTNIPELINKISVLGHKEACSSDHFGLHFEIKLDVPKSKTCKHQVYNYAKADWKSLNFDLKKVDWISIVDTHDPHESWPTFKSILANLCDKHIPKRTVKYQFQPPWFDSDCEKILLEKEKWRARAKSPTGTEEDYEKFRKLRKQFKKIMDEKMRLNVEDDTDPSLISKKFWKYVKSKTKSTRIPETVWYKDKFRNDSQEQADLFNEFFFSQFSSESKYDIDISFNANDRFSSIKFHELDVLLLLKEINPSKAAGPDGLHGMVLKNCAAALSKPLTTLFNISYVTGCIPEDWKLASIVPIHKKGEKGSVDNYRPVSLTSLIMKVFEKCIKKELLAECEGLIDPRQHGFVNSKSCTTQMVPFIYDLEMNMNKKTKVVVVYFDFAKAFDSVSHDIILHKLKHNYKIDGMLLSFIKSYLKDRHQQVVIGGRTSSRLPVLSGVPQGSILGPLLFVLFIDDMFSCISPGTNIALYADDTKIWREINYSTDNFALQRDIDKLYNWSMANKMKFHPSKCKALSVTNQRNILHNLPFTVFIYKLSSEFIDYVPSQVDLGVILNTKLNWKEHWNKLTCKANSQLGLLMRTCHFTMDKRQKKTFYLTVVRSIFEHCSIIWHPRSNNQIYKFDAVQKRAVKWIFGQCFEHYSDDLYFNKQKELNILPIKLKFFLNDLLLFYKIINSLVAIKLPEQFYFTSSKDLRYTRQNINIIDKKGYYIH